MTRRLAYVNSAILVWARTTAGWDINVVASKLKVKSDKITKWESGQDYPSLSQLRRLAKLYKLSITIFYLPSPPAIKIKIPRDYRRLAGTTLQKFPPELIQLMRTFQERREQYIEVTQRLEQQSVEVKGVLSLKNSPVQAGTIIRNVIGLEISAQAKWPDARVAFNSLRALVEQAGILVFQFSERSIRVEDTRGFSYVERPLPIIAINRKDTYTARTFTLMHELTHVLLRLGGVCNVSDDVSQLPEELALEIYCNAVAAEALVPADALIDIAKSFTEPSQPSDDEIRLAASEFGVSREVIVRRLLTLNIVGRSFYSQKRKEYAPSEVAKQKKSGGPAPTTNAVSLLGIKFVSAIFEAVSTQRITVSDASDYLELKTKHIPKIPDYLAKLGA